MIVDAHAHLWYDESVKNKELTLKVARAYNVKKFFVSTLAGLLESPFEDEIRNCNEMTYGFMKEHPGLIEGMAYLNPVNSNSVDELRRCVEDYGFIGIKVWVAVFCDDVRMNPIAEAAIKYNIPMLIHCFKKTTGQVENETLGIHIANLARRYPELKIQMAHLGANVYDTIKSVKDYKNVYTDFSGSVYRRDDLDYTIKHMGVERVVFGSDMPGCFEDCMGQVEAANITEEERKLIYYGNACRIFGMEVPV